jgi:uncharacterized membrane protein
MRKAEDIAVEILKTPFAALDEPTKKVARHVAARTHIARNVGHAARTSITFGQRAADAVASFGGSWVFVGLFATCMLVWVALNTVLLLSRGATFDPYPYILLNLFLSMLAAIQAPVILMSQNRQAEKDRLALAHDYEVNLKAEIEIMLLHEKLDQLRDQPVQDLLRIQHEQLKLLTDLVGQGSRRQ